MSTIVTLTMNPALDISTTVERVEPVRKLRCGAGRRDPGGGGVNVARVAHRLGATAIAVYPVGGFVGQLLRRSVDAEGVRSVTVEVEGETREDFTAFETSSGQQYRFVLPGPVVHGVEWLACLKRLASLDVRPDILCASGSLPPGAPVDFYARVAEIAESWGVRFVLDSSGPPLARALDEKLFLIKPNLRELRDLVGEALEDQGAIVGACRRLLDHRRIEAIAVTLGADGALLITHGGAWRSPALSVRALNTVGAGDSFLGAMCWALADGMKIEDAFRYGMAGGAAALVAAGTELCDPATVRRLVGQATLEEIKQPTAAE